MMSDSNTQLVKNVVAQPVHLVLSKSARGVYFWEISLYGENKDEVMKVVEEANAELERRYGNGSGREGEQCGPLQH